MHVPQHGAVDYLHRHSIRAKLVYRVMYLHRYRHRHPHGIDNPQGIGNPQRVLPPGSDAHGQRNSEKERKGDSFHAWRISCNSWSGVTVVCVPVAISLTVRVCEAISFSPTKTT